MERVGDHPIPSGPLGPRWLAYELGALRSGAATTARIVIENAGSATWRSRGDTGVQLAYHWLDVLGNPIVWDGLRTPLPRPVRPGEEIEISATVVAPRPPGKYLLTFDLVEEHLFWFAAIGAPTLGIPADVLPRLERRSLAVVVHGGSSPETAAALAAQEEPLTTGDPTAVAHLVAGAIPAPDWSRRMLDAHDEGWAAVGPAVVAHDRRDRRRLEAWSPSGRNPRFEQPLLLPSLLAGLEPGTHAGLPAWSGGEGLFDGLAEVRLPQRSGRRRA